jgi:hypothetical protein
MFARVLDRRKFLGRVAALGTLALASACAPVGTVPGVAADPRRPRSRPARRCRWRSSCLRGSADPAANLLAQNLENAARLAIADLNGVPVDLRVYATGGNPSQAAVVAQTAVAEGAAIILGPVSADEANAAGVAVAASGVNVLAFSNNPTIAGGNVFLLGPTFRNTADRLIRYGARPGDRPLSGGLCNDLGRARIGRDAIAAAAQANGATSLGAQVYALSQQGIQAAAPAIARPRRRQAPRRSSPRRPSADLPILATALPEAGLSPRPTRLDGPHPLGHAPQLLALPGCRTGSSRARPGAHPRSSRGRYRAAHGRGAAPARRAGL